MFGKSITRPVKARARHLEPVPPLPIRSVLIALLALVASTYALVRHYARRDERTPPSAGAPRTEEIPAPELVPVEK